MSKYTENFPKLETYDLETVFCQLKEVCGADPGGLISMQFKSRPTTAKDIALLLTITYKILKSQIELQRQFVELYNFVKDFFENLDLQEEVNKWLQNAYDNGLLLQLLISNFPEYNKLLNLYKYPDIYVDTTDYDGISGLDSTSLYNWDINKIYDLYDLLLTDQIFTKELLGYGSNASGESDNKLPIYIYKYRGRISNNNGVRKPKLVVLTSGLHGNEKGSVYSLYLFVKYGITQRAGKLVNDFWSKYDFDIIPICNPFGFNNAINSTPEEITNNKGRYNARGVDLNRNFASGWSASTPNSGTSAESELETKILTKYFKSLDVNNLFSYSDWHTTFNDEDYDTTTQVWIQSTSVLNKNVDLVNNVIRDLSLQLAETQGIVLSNQYINLTNNLFMPTSGSMIGEFCFVTKHYENVFIFEGGKRYYDNISKSFIYNYEKNLISLSEVAYTTLGRLSDDTIDNYGEALWNKTPSNFLNGDNNIGKSYDDIRKTSYAIISSDIVTLPAFKTFKLFVSEKGYKVRLLYLNESNVINGDSGWHDYIENTPSKDNKAIVVVRKQNSQYIAPFMIGTVFNIILNINDVFNSNYNVGATSDVGTITFQDYNKAGRIGIFEFELVTSSKVAANTAILNNLPTTYRANASGLYAALCSDNKTTPTTYPIMYSGNGSVKTTSEIPNNTTLRGTLVFLT